MTGTKRPIVPLLKGSDLEGHLWISPKSRGLRPDDPDDSRWPSREVIARAAPALVEIINRRLSVARQFADVRLPVLNTDGLDPDLRRELEAERCELFDKLSRWGMRDASTRSQEAARHRDVLRLQSLHIRLGLPIRMLSDHDTIRPGPKRRAWEDHDFLKALGEEAKAVLEAAGAPADMSAGGQPDGVVARFLAVAILHLYPDPPADAATLGKLRRKPTKPVSPRAHRRHHQPQTTKRLNYYVTKSLRSADFCAQIEMASLQHTTL